MLSLYIACGYFVLQGHMQVATPEVVLPAKPTLLTTWPFIKQNVADPCSITSLMTHGHSDLPVASTGPGEITRQESRVSKLTSTRD